MSEFAFLIGYRHVSTWSLRGWLIMRKTGAPFEELMIRYRLPEHKARLTAMSPTSKVPLLIHDRGDHTVKVWDSIAIGEYLAEIFPGQELWPEDPVARAVARSISAEMHSGFRALRDRLDFDLLGYQEGVSVDDEPVASEVLRVQQIWTECRETYGEQAGGPYLFGHFTIADAMYAPIAARFRTYGVTLDPVAEAYKQALLSDPDRVAWAEAARMEDPPEPKPS